MRFARTALLPMFGSWRAVMVVAAVAMSVAGGLWLLLVRDEEGRLLVPADRISPAIATVLRHLANNPDDAGIRVAKANC